MYTAKSANFEVTRVLLDI